MVAKDRAGGGFSFDGMLGFDALVQLAPLAFQVDVAAAIALRYRGRLLMGISFKGMLAGPTPWHVEGKATIKILFFKGSVSFERQFGSRTAPPLPEAVDVLALVDVHPWIRRHSEIGEVGLDEQQGARAQLSTPLLGIIDILKVGQRALEAELGLIPPPLLQRRQPRSNLVVLPLDRVL